ncbi:hypothetical protein [Manganibacter manganicus]|uniref:Uncharacterized protein n=1 Tax=Manganibacter manganicus TaxID=1873176 RepID=A0A1V8RSS5_9HYPH|nr:hypothetical protein [Pseudaminobacter manganicus]OQM76227.1 hypothetical protein BFN67_15135 [Pseudaminobacter manganicus]
MIGFPGLSEIYEYRHALSAAVMHWERYGMIFSKFVGGFSFGYLAISRRSSRYLIGSALIFISDYMLSGQRSSLVFIVIVILSYLWFVSMRRRFKISDLLLGLSGLTISLGLASFLLGRISPYVIGIYDRAFHVSVGLFVRYLEQVEEVGLYWGGDGLLGEIFGGNGQDYRIVIGRNYFGPNVSANADLVSDAYINFGVGGPFFVFLILRLLISRRDSKFFLHNREAALVFIIPYMFALFSMGLQTALVTGALAVALLIMKITSIRQEHGISGHTPSRLKTY